MEKTAVPHYNSKRIDDDMNSGESYETYTHREYFRCRPRSKCHPPGTLCGVRWQGFG